MRYKRLYLNSRREQVAYEELEGIPDQWETEVGVRDMTAYLSKGRERVVYWGHDSTPEQWERASGVRDMIAYLSSEMSSGDTHATHRYVANTTTGRCATSLKQ